MRLGLEPDIDILQDFQVGKLVEDIGNQVDPVGHKQFDIPNLFVGIEAQADLGDDARRSQPAQKEAGQVGQWWGPWRTSKVLERASRSGRSRRWAGQPPGR